MRYPPAPRRRWPSRILAVLATAAFLGSGVAIVMMVMPKPEEEPATVNTAPPPAAEQPKAEKRGLTKSQRAARRAAVRTLAEQGYEPVRLNDWKPRNDLRVLIGETDTGAMRAFFFVKRYFVGNDDAATSSRLKVSTVGDEAITLSYGLTTGGSEKVRFEWLDGTLQATGGTVPASTLR